MRKPTLIKKESKPRIMTTSRIMAIMNFDGMIVMQTEYQTYKFVGGAWEPIEIKE